MSPKSRIDEHMTEYPTITSRTATVHEAIELMDSRQIRHLAVVEESVVVGVLSDRDLKQAELLADSMVLIVSDFMAVDPYCVRVGTPLADVAREMALRKIGSAVVLNKVGSVVGIFTTTDALRVLSEILSSPAAPELKLFGIEKLLSGSYLVGV